MAAIATFAARAEDMLHNTAVPGRDRGRLRGHPSSAGPRRRARRPHCGAPLADASVAGTRHARPGARRALTEATRREGDAAQDCAGAPGMTRARVPAMDPKPARSTAAAAYAGAARRPWNTPLSPA